MHEARRTAVHRKHPEDDLLWVRSVLTDTNNSLAICDREQLAQGFDRLNRRQAPAKGTLMETRWIEAFITVAEELHFARAAERLGVAQSPLSQMVKKLEREVGTPLFERSTRSVSLTSAGRSFLPHARGMLAELDLGARALTGVPGEYGTVRVGFSGALNHRTLPQLAVAAQSRFPGISLTLVHQVVTSDALRQLRSGEIDVAFVGSPIVLSGLATRVISREPLGVILPSRHRLAGERMLRLADLADDGFVTLPQQQGSTTREVTVQACVAAGFRPRVVQEVIDPYLVLLFVAAGLGVSLVPSSLEQIVPPGAIFRPLAGEAPVLEAGIAWNPGRASRAVRVILDLAEEVLPTPVE